MIKTYLVITVCLFVSNILDAQNAVKDEPFWQEYHEGYAIGKSRESNEVRSIVADDQRNVWIATANGIYLKKLNENNWTAILKKEDEGPAYSVVADRTGKVWMGTWNSVFVYDNNQLKNIPGTEGPIAVMCHSEEGMYALGPKGIWLFDGAAFQKKEYIIPRSIRNAVAAKDGGIWIATDVGLYYLNNKQVKTYQAKDLLLSAAVKDIAFDAKNNLWAGGLGGISILQNEKQVRTITPKEGCPSIYVNAVKKDAEGCMWVGTNMGVVRYQPDGSHTLRFSRRWLMNDHVTAITFDKEGTAWIGTVNGVSAIKKRKMDLAQKADFFYDVLMKRHIRDPWIAGQCRLTVAGDISNWMPDDDDNDGEYTSNYLAMEVFRYAVTKSQEAKINARKAFGFLQLLQEVAGNKGFFARTIVPASGWKGILHDGNRTYTQKELSEELVKEPRFKAVEERWRKSADGKWLWKGDASSDEMCGHMMGYFFYYELAADDAEKIMIGKHVAKIVDHLIANNFNMMDIDGTHTRWSVWSPEQLNRDPEWSPDRSQNSMEMLTFLKLAYHVTGDIKYQQQYLRLIREEKYLENMAKVKDQNPAWFIYFDVVLQAYLYPILLKCETDPQLLSFYSKHMDEWMAKRKGDKNPLINFLYCYARNKKVELNASVDLLKDTPLDLVSWPIDHTKREDIQIVHYPVLDDYQVSELPPASIRGTIRWDSNPWAAINGNPVIEREPVFWLLPYWMGRYLKMIE